MDNILLDVKREIEEEITFKQSINKAQCERIEYINNVITQLEEKFFALMNRSIKISDFRNFLYSLNNSIIYRKTTEKLINLTYEIEENSFTKNNVQWLYNEIAALNRHLNNIRKSKQIDSLIKSEGIDKLKKLINIIDENGEFLEPIDSIEYIDHITKVLIYIRSKYVSSDYISQFMYEVTSKNNTAIRKYEAKKNAKVIIKKRERQEIEKKHFDTAIPSFNEEQQQIYDTAKKIIDENKEKIGKLSEIENEYLIDLKNIKSDNINEIDACVEIMENTDSSMALIINGLNDVLENINDGSLDANFKKISKFTNLYNKYTDLIQKESKEKIKDDETTDKIRLLEEKISRIINTLSDDKKNVFDNLTESQIKMLNSFSDISDIENYDKIDGVLKKQKLSIEFLLLYNRFGLLNDLLEEYDIFKEEYNNEKRLNVLEEIENYYDKYLSIKKEYNEKINNETQEEYIDEETITEDKTNILIYLVDETKKTTYIEKYIESEKQFIPRDYKNLLYLIDRLKTLEPDKLHVIADKVKPYNPDYKARRLEKDGNSMRLSYLALSKKPSNGKQVYLVINAGTKTDSKNAAVYGDVNSLRETAMQYRDYVEGLSDEEYEILIYKQNEIEKEMLENIKPKKLAMEGELNGKKYR